jgi:hypothetical protein
LVTCVVQVGYAVLEANPLALPLPELTVQTPAFWTPVPDHCHGTYPRGIGIDPDVLDCHIRYIVAPKDSLTLLSLENSSVAGESLVDPEEAKG